MIGIIFATCSLIYIILMAIMYFSKERIDSDETKIYAELIKVCIFCVSTELISTYLNRYVVGFDVVKDISLKLIVVFLFSWMFIFSSYIFVVSSQKLRYLLSKVSWYIYIPIVLLLLLLPINSVMDGNIILYTEGPCVIASYIITSILLFLCLLCLIIYRKKIDRKKIIPLYVFFILGIAVVVIQAINPALLLLSSLDVLITILMYFTIENPDVKMIEQLEYARDAADKANAAKTDFLSSMSHEIRTPLNAIVGFSDCIKHSDTLDEAKENADDIINASNTLLEIVNGILDISKIEAGKLEIVNSDYNAPDLFSGLGKLITPKMKEKGLDFQVSIAPDLPNTLYGDPASIKKVITNMLSNAYKYTDKGYVKYDVKCVNSNGVCRLIVTVEDSGRGIKKESIDKLFTKFQRVEEDKNTTIEGTGLGLAITKQLIELMGGSIVVTSEYGEGSRFTITLDQRIDNVDVKKESSKVEAVDLTGKKILIVDDNNVNLKVETKLFTRYNAVVTCCNSGFECIDRINKKEEYDIILMDDMMPKMSGTETLKKLKESSSFNIPVVALTANAISGMRERYIESGFDDYLAKPIEIEEVYKVFGKLFETSNVEVLSLNVSSDINNNVDFLEANNIDVKHGLELLGDMEMYNSTMNDFIDEMATRIPLLDNYKNQNDMPNYAILVHAIKSDCKYLGIMFLADIAYEHELKSKDNDSEFVNKNYDSLISTIDDVLIICKKYLGRD